MKPSTYSTLVLLSIITDTYATASNIAPQLSNDPNYALSHTSYRQGSPHLPLLRPPDKLPTRPSVTSTPTPITTSGHFNSAPGDEIATSLPRFWIVFYSMNFVLISFGIAMFMINADESHMAVVEWECGEGLDADGLSMRDRRLEEGYGGDSDDESIGVRSEYHFGDNSDSDTDVETKEVPMSPVDMQVKRWTSGAGDFSMF
ncbi:hypothetical protein BJ508DRAFT_415926 [Ascobolus immersus RN42]|uniref:Uncharacterized protein n=1 Tax=Ascobolus immersus RN42 TaxID=1160509 RepID=A0A3N4I006_ASCIM|nr:hypothetical protein BJ508DRAFT_415926 [Ascobolus immersus RN42]